MTRDPLREALRSLPRERAGANFTPRLMARLAEERRLPALWSLRGRLSWRSTWQTAAAAVVLAGLLAAGGVALSRLAGGSEAGGAIPAAPASRRARIERFEAERAHLAAELQELKRMADTEDPVIYLGGDDRVDLVLDVGRLARQYRDDDGRRVEPAAYRRPPGR